jgi:hypothetical protein
MAERMYRATLYFTDKENVGRPASNIFLEAPTAKSAFKVAEEEFEKALDEAHLPDGAAFRIEIRESCMEEAETFKECEKAHHTTHRVVN